MFASMERDKDPSSADAGSRSAAPLASIRQIARTEQVREQIEAAIERGDFQPGDRLPSERDLVAMTGVSRVTVREAIRSLEAVGLVEVQHGRGCFVTRGPGDDYVDSFGRWLSIHREEVLELVKVRGALDALAAESAAARREPEIADRLDELNAAFVAAQAAEPRDVDELRVRDRAFHNAIAEASQSPLLATLLHELRDQIDRSAHVLLGDPRRARASAREHAALIAAIRAGDPEAARRAAEAHIERIAAFLAAAEPAAPVTSP